MPPDSGRPDSGGARTRRAATSVGRGVRYVLRQTRPWPALLMVVCLVAGVRHEAVADGGGAGPRKQVDLLEELSWRDPFRTARAWSAQPTWLSRADAKATVTAADGVGQFRVPTPGAGMKWSRAMASTSLEDTPWLVVRYRAEGLHAAGEDYLIYLDDGVAGRQLNAIRLGDAVADGAWRTVAVDVSALTEAGAARGLAVQVQAARNAQHGATLWIDWLAMMPRPPVGAKVLVRTASAKPLPTWQAPVASAAFEARPSWLSNPAAEGEFAVSREGTHAVFHAGPASRGMKWHWPLASPISLTGRRYVALRYRASGVAPRGDYAVCAIAAKPEKGRDYAAVVPSAELISDGRWHMLCLPVSADVRHLAAAGALAVQVQADRPDAQLELASLSLTNERPSSPLSDAIDWQPDGSTAGWHAADLRAVCNQSSRPWREFLRLSDWLPAGRVTACGVPFVLPASGASTRPSAGAASSAGAPSSVGVPSSPHADLAATSLRRREELHLPIEPPMAACEVGLLALAAMTGQDEPCYGSGRFREIRDVDRFRVRLEYAAGPPDECLPLRVPARRFSVTHGLQVLIAAADPARKLKAVVLDDRCTQAAFAVAAVTLRTAKSRQFPQALEELPLLRHVARKIDDEPHTIGGARDDGGLCVNHTGRQWGDATLRIFNRGGPHMWALTGGENWKFLSRPVSIVGLSIDGTDVPRRQWRTKKVEDADIDTDESPAGSRVTYRLPHGIELKLHLAFIERPKGRAALCVDVENVVNTDVNPHRVSLVAPRIGPYKVAKKAADAWYLVPKSGAVLDNKPAQYRERYGGTFPVQFLDTFSPAHGRGLCLLTFDRDCRRKEYLLTKSADGSFTMGVSYPERTLRPGESFAAAPAALYVTDGHWRRGLDLYTKWRANWHKPAAPRKRWFREVFNFRQRFLWAHDPLVRPGAKAIDLTPALAEARREFGGIEYLHLFDWGNVPGVGRMYGRVGDLSPFDHMPGGRAGLARAIADLRKQGTPVGLYIEGYLLEEKGRLGQAHGKQWQLVGPGGKGKYWPHCSEMFICPGAEGWRRVQEQTYAAKVRELNVDGMYIDEFGFANAHKDCYSREHGHGVPSFAARTERDMTRRIRRAVDAARKGVALYTEETPVDVTCGYQDGSFTYAMRRSQLVHTRVPLNLTRFAFPDFKTIEILRCDKPTGSWATGVRWVFFNGEAIWLEGPAATWFAPQTRQTIRRCHRILRRYRAAFTSETVVPLVQTEMGGVWANAFCAPGGTVVYTLYNARHRTVRGPVLRLRAGGGSTACPPPVLRAGGSYHDAWHERPIRPRVVGGDHLIELELAPHGVGCVVVSPVRKRGSGSE